MESNAPNYKVGWTVKSVTPAGLTGIVAGYTAPDMHGQNPGQLLVTITEIEKGATHWDADDIGFDQRFAINGVNSLDWKRGQWPDVIAVD
jgi:hypothetical protein|tara:strand:+ start:34921 stop:35190 length:270 start_codon:yes stop_codon:yes gene_type:complete